MILDWIYFFKRRGFLISISIASVLDFAYEALLATLHVLCSSGTGLSA